MPRREKKYHYIYRTTCQITGKFYVGMHSTNDLEDGYLGSGKILGYSIGKHGRENHIREILEHLPNREALKLRERELVNEELLVHPLNINLKYGGEGGGFLAEANKTNRFHRAGYDAMMMKKDHSAAIRKSWKRNYDKMLPIVRANAVKMIAAAASPGAIAKKKATFERIGHAQGAKNSQYGTCWVTKDEHPVKIKINELDEYLANGFRRGRKAAVRESA